MSSIDRIKVVARIRPLSAKERAHEEEVVTHVSADSAEVCVQSSSGVSTRKTYRYKLVIVARTHALHNVRALCQFSSAPRCVAAVL